MRRGATIRWMLLLGWMAMLAACGSDTGSDQEGMKDGDGDGGRTEEPPLEDGDSPLDGDSVPVADGDYSGEHSSEAFYPPMISDPELLPLLFGPSLLGVNVNFGETILGTLPFDHPYDAYTFDALAGARVTVWVEPTGALPDAPAGMVVALYGPRRTNGLWGEAIAQADGLSSEGRALIPDHPVALDGAYLLIVGDFSGAGGADYRLLLGCVDQCREPRCPDLTCLSYCEAGWRSDPDGCSTCECPAKACACASDQDCPYTFLCQDCACWPASSPVDGDSDSGWSESEDDPCGCLGEADSPVCGLDETTYANECLALCAGTEVNYPGDCGGPITGNECRFDSDCAESQICLDGFCRIDQGCNCSGEYVPVCGLNGLTYNNACEAACEGVAVAAEGICPGSDCRPVCRVVGSVQSWVDGCSGALLTYDTCLGCEAVCQSIATRQEGYYSTCTGSLIAYADCAYGCGCDNVYDPVCASDGSAYPNACEAACAGHEVAYAGSCRDGVLGCGDSSDCPDQMLCSFNPSCLPENYNLSDACRGTCTAPPQQLPCSNDSACPVGMACLDGVCAMNDPVDCVVTGCNGEICAPASVASSCLWQPVFGCLESFAVCAPAAEGTCAFVPVDDEALAACSNGFSSNHACATDADCGAEEFCGQSVCQARQCVCPTTRSEVCTGSGAAFLNACEALCQGVSAADLIACP